MAAESSRSDSRTPHHHVISEGIFLVLGALASGLGLHDLFRGTIIEAQVYGGAIGAAGIFMFTAGLGLLVEPWRQEWGTHIAVIAGIVGVVLGAFLLVDQLQYRDGPHVLLLAAWAGWIIASVIAILLRPKPEPVPKPSRQDGAVRGFWVTVVATLSSLGIGATLLFSVLQFAYQQVKASPSNNAYGLSISQQLGDDGQSVDRQFHQFAVHVTLKNPTGFQVQMLRSTYAVFGRSLSPQSASDDDFAQRLLAARLNGSFGSRYLRYGPRQLVEEGEMLTTPFPLQPAQEFTAEFEVALPQDQVQKFDYLRLETNFILAKGTRLHAHPGQRRSIGACSYFDESADQCILTEWQITSPGWLWTLTKGSQKVETVEGIKTKSVADENQAAWIGTCIIRDVAQGTGPARSVCGDSRRDEALEKFFDLAHLSPIAYEEPIQAAR